MSAVMQDDDRLVHKPIPKVGEANFGDLRRLTPVSRTWGFDRGQPVDRYYIERYLQSHREDIHGAVLEVGDDTYTHRIGGDRVISSDVLNLHASEPRTTLAADLTHAPHLAPARFDCVIATQTLQLIYDVGAAVGNLRRILRTGGVLLATFPGITHTQDARWSDAWCWSFTPTSTERLFQSAFGANVEVTRYGNVLSAAAFLFGFAAEELEPAELEFNDPGYDVTICVRAVNV